MQVVRSRNIQAWTLTVLHPLNLWHLVVIDLSLWTFLQTSSALYVMRCCSGQCRQTAAISSVRSAWIVCCSMRIPCRALVPRISVSSSPGILQMWVDVNGWLKSLAPGRFEWNFRYLIFRIISVIDGWVISYELALRWMSLNLKDDKSTLVQVMAWCRKATNHYLHQCWPRSMSPYDVTRPQWVNAGLCYL